MHVFFAASEWFSASHHFGRAIAQMGHRARKRRVMDSAPAMGRNKFPPFPKLRGTRKKNLSPGLFFGFPEAAEGVRATKVRNWRAC